MYHTALKWRKKVYTVIIRTRESIGDSLTQKKKKNDRHFYGYSRESQIKENSTSEPKELEKKALITSSRDKD